MSRGRERSGKPKSAERLLAYEVNGERVVVDVRAMTMRERSELRHALSTLPVEADEVDWQVGAVWIALRRKDSSITFDEVFDSMTLGEMLDREPVDPEADSPEA